MLWLLESLEPLVTVVSSILRFGALVRYINIVVNANCFSVRNIKIAFCLRLYTLYSEDIRKIKV